MRMIDAIARGAFRFSHVHHVDSDTLRKMRSALIGLGRSAHCVDFGNVVKWAQEKGYPDLILHSNDSRLRELAPLCRMPFHVMWFEHTLTVFEPPDIPEPTRITIGHLVHESAASGDDWDPRHLEQDTFLQGSGPVELQAYSNMFLTGEFSLDEVATVFSTAEEDKPENFGQRRRHNYVHRGLLVGIALSFFNCRNVTVRQVPPPRKHAKAYQQKYGIALKPFGVIEVHKNMKRSESESHSAGGELQGSHIVRGHFKRYADEEGHRLGGKYAGLWFWESHVRGSGAAPIRSYRVWGPNQEHEPKCIVGGSDEGKT